MPNKFKIPDVIYLQCHNDDGELFDISGEEVTWCEDDVDGHNIKYNGKQPKGREIEMINMSLREIEEETAWKIYQNTNEVEYENRLFMGRM
jgi:hypothetical protein